jgi:hypothetical protein
VTVLVERPEVKDCDPNPPPDGLPGFQGLAGSRLVSNLEILVVGGADRVWRSFMLIVR